ncbi:Trk system potassium uptake protein TrkA [bioreactor metagenome]|uniref:Trk system potassium uptake protein TrkA n=1 Tax=bioreactor metagenome TaxID=1076179 RepID=A0A645HB40_9ZZZZ
MGSYIASILLNNHHEVKIIENRENVIEKLKKEFRHDEVIFGSGTNPNVLEAAGIAQANVVAAVTGADEVNLVASTIAKFEFGVPRIIARVNNPKNKWLFNNGMGVDVRLNQADLMAHLVVEEMNLDAMLTLLKVSRGNYSIVQFKVGENSVAAEKCLKDIAFPKNSVIIAIYKEDKIFIAHGNDKFEVGDKVLAFADEKAQEELNSLFS